VDTTRAFVHKWRGISIFVAVSLVVFGMSLLLIEARGQGNSDGTFTGTVSNSSGAPISGAQVVLTKVDSNLAPMDTSWTVVSANDGSFSFQSLALGPYRVQVKKDGFAPYQQSLIGLMRSHTSQVSIKLNPQPKEEGNVLASTWHHPDDGLKLPPYIRHLAYFGERPDWSLDGKHIIFLEKTFGDVFEVDVETGVVRSITDHYFHSGYTRALYMANGDVLLSGSREFSPENPWASRNDTAELWVLQKGFDKPAVPLGERCFEGPASSRTRMRIAWTVQHTNYPDRIPEGDFQFWMADIQSVNGVPTIANKRKILDSSNQPFHRMETRSFRPPLEKELTFGTSVVGLDDVMGLDLETGKVVDYTKTPDFNEPKGIFPDGQYTTVLSNRAHPGLFALDIWKLRLDGSNQAERLTYLSEDDRFRGSNSSISDDGKYMAFQLAVNGEPAGVGHGILLYDFAAAKKYFAEQKNKAPH
jgi:hypothetical protein